MTLKKWSKRHSRALKIAVIILTIQLSLTLFQRSRYIFEVNNEENYCCWHMSRDCEHFFESMGIHTRQIYGCREEIGPEGSVTSKCHRWLLVDLGFVNIPFESTSLCFFDPQWIGFDTRGISEGYCTDGKYCTNNQLEWDDWE